MTQQFARVVDQHDIFLRGMEDRKYLTAWCCLRARPNDRLITHLRHWTVGTHVLSVGSGSGYLEHCWMQLQPEIRVTGVDVVPCNRFLSDFHQLPRGHHTPGII